LKTFFLVFMHLTVLTSRCRQPVTSIYSKFRNAFHFQKVTKTQMNTFCLI